MTRKQLRLSTPRFTYLGVPAPAGMSDCYESISRPPIRDKRSKGSARQKNVALALVPGLGKPGRSPTKSQRRRRGGFQTHLFQLIAQNGVLVLENADGHDHFAGHARPRPTLF